ncbi:cytochrome P450 [Streptomyces sp. NPDC002039]|uniref:cytochrome P450 n=1 Tax=unclassified Streptomyces TaxID=2593676 RepID=UPI0033164CB2
MTQSTTTRGQAAPTEGGRPARARRAEAVRFAATHTLPVLVRDLMGPHARLLRPGPGRPRWPAATLRALRARHGGAPVLLRGPTGPTLVLLDPLDLPRFHEAPPSELATCPPDKCRAPGAAPVAGGPTRDADPGRAPEPDRDDLRARRREVNEIVLASGSPVHPSCGPFLAVIADEAGRLGASHALRLAPARHTVTRAARRMVLGDTAAGDEELAGWLDRLDAGGDRGAPRKHGAAETLYEKAGARIARYAAAAEPYTLVGRARRHPDPAGTLDPIGQALHWLRALDAVPATLLRTLLLLAAHPAEQDAACAEARSGGAAKGELPRLRACVQETLRLYPVVPDLVRVTRTETEWRGVRHPAGTPVLLPALFHQRDPDHVPAAHAFVPGRWTSPGSREDLRMAPFGHGAGRCPGDRLALLVVAAFCAELLRGHRVRDGRPALDPVGPLPAALDPRRIRLTITRR